jgi:hypothetical protein
MKKNLKNIVLATFVIGVLSLCIGGVISSSYVPHVEGTLNDLVHQHSGK